MQWAQGDRGLAWPCCQRGPGQFCPGITAFMHATAGILKSLYQSTFLTGNEMDIKNTKLVLKEF